MSAIFILKKEAPKNHNLLILLKGRFFVIRRSIDMNVCVFWGTSAGSLKSVVVQLFVTNIAKVILVWMSKVGQNSTARKK